MRIFDMINHHLQRNKSVGMVESTATHVKLIGVCIPSTNCPCIAWWIRQIWGCLPQAYLITCDLLETAQFLITILQANSVVQNSIGAVIIAVGSACSGTIVQRSQEVWHCLGLSSGLCRPWTENDVSKAVQITRRTSIPAGLEGAIQAGFHSKVMHVVPREY